MIRIYIEIDKTVIIKTWRAYEIIFYTHLPNTSME